MSQNIALHSMNNVQGPFFVKNFHSPNLYLQVQQQPKTEFI